MSSEPCTCVYQTPYTSYIGTGVGIVFFIISEILGTRKNKTNKCTSIVQVCGSGVLRLLHKFGLYDPEIVEETIEGSDIELGSSSGSGPVEENKPKRVRTRRVPKYMTPEWKIELRS